ncbi:nicotinate-nucleotide--dimethylbenzimidazole phosphoribosyltransferase, partial [Streptomyces carpinensis]
MSSLNLDDFTDLIERPDGGVRRDAEARRERRIVPPGSLGRLDDLGEWLAAAQGVALSVAGGSPLPNCEALVKEMLSIS